MARMMEPAIVDGVRLPQIINDQAGYLLGPPPPKPEWQGLLVPVLVRIMPTKGARMVERMNPIPLNITRTITTLTRPLIIQPELRQIYPQSRMTDMTLLLQGDTLEMNP